MALTISLWAGEAASLSFTTLRGLDDKLEKEAAIQLLRRQLTLFHQHEVEVRGFLYQSADQRWILASEPNLKVCCMGAPSKISQQIFLSGKALVPSNQAVTVRGLFQVDPLWGEQGILQQLYRMENTMVVSRTTWPLSSFAMAGAGIASVIFLCILRRMGKS